MTDENKAVINFNINDARIADVAEEFKEIDAYKDLPAAKAAKKVLTKMRTTLKDAHEEQKADALQTCQSLDAEKRRLLALIEPIEDPITDQLIAIKNAEAEKEMARLDAIENAIQEIIAHAADRHDLDVTTLQSRIDSLTAIDITEEVFQEQLDLAETHREEGLMKLRISLNKATEAAEEAKRQQEIADENARKQAELDKEREEFEAEKQRQADEQAERDRKAREEKNAQIIKDRKEEDARLAKEREELAKEQKAIDEENARLAKEKADKQAEEEAREEEERKLRLAPDSDKLEVWAHGLESVKLPEVESVEAKRIVHLAVEKSAAAIKYIRDEARKMQ